MEISIFLFIFIFIFIFIFFYIINNNFKIYLKEQFSDFDSIRFKYSDSVGFYSNLFVVINNYIYCYKNNLYFDIDDSQWLFKTNKGWEDYFLNINLNIDKKKDNLKITKHIKILENYPIYEYKNILPQFYKYNNNTINEINKIKKKFNLENNDYDSIFIRRGDKLTVESKYISTKEYFDFLININPKCKKIFLQTDDYNCFLDLKDIVKNKNIEIFTLCNSNSFGVIVNNSEKKKFINSSKNQNNQNFTYMSKINNKILNTKPVCDMNPSEIYNHTITMIIGVDLLINSNICVLDYQSNVSRFIKLFHPNINNVYDIITKSNVIDLNKNICPVYSF